MSTSTTSKTASDDSPPTGDATDEKRSTRRDVSVELEVSRQRTAGWTVFGIVVGTLCILKLGTVGVWAGIALIVVGAYRGYQLAQTFLNKPGTIEVTASGVSLPRGLCTNKPLTVQHGDVTAVYMLRRSVPWHRAAPVLVVELGAKAMIYPRDWFATEADQRAIVTALVGDRLKPADSDA